MSIFLKHIVNSILNQFWQFRTFFSFQKRRPFSAIRETALRNDESADTLRHDFINFVHLLSYIHMFARSCNNNSNNNNDIIVIMIIIIIMIEYAPASHYYIIPLVGLGRWDKRSARTRRCYELIWMIAIQSVRKDRSTRKPLSIRHFWEIWKKWFLRI